MLKRCLVSLLVVGPLFFPSAAQATEWRVPGDFGTIQEAIDAAAAGDVIFVAPGAHAGAIVWKAVEIRGEGGAVISSGPKPWAGYGAPRNTFEAGFLFPGNGAGTGATISHLKFEGVEFPVFSRGANDVTVTQNAMINAIQAITSWAGAQGFPGFSFGQGWTITHNEITDLQTSCGGGIGIIIADYMGGTTSTDNLVAHNKISGTLHVAAGDCGGYNGSGVVLYADYRSGGAGGQLTFNRVMKNSISLASDTPGVVDVAALELTEALAPSGTFSIYNNSASFNDLRGTTLQLVLTPDTLDLRNNVTKNLGENRGHGLHPKAFSPE